jgi:hypothetical protein
MKGVRVILIAVIAFGLAGIAGAAGPRTLTKAGDLFSVAVVDNQVVLSAKFADGTFMESAVPQSAGAVERTVQVSVDPATGAVLVLWQRLQQMNARIKLAALVDGTWVGPTTIAGNDGTAAFNPQMVIHQSISRYLDESADGSDPVEYEIATTFLHLLWWSQATELQPGSAHYAAVRLDSHGVPEFVDLQERVLADLLPYGTLCREIENIETLKHPMLFIDPQSSNPHMFFTDYEGCAFHIMELQPTVEIVDDDVSETKRRRQIIILRHRTTVGIRPNLKLESAKLEVGANLSIVMHWDGDNETLNYVQLDQNGTSEVKTLKLDENLNHERAVELIRGLTN